MWIDIKINQPTTGDIVIVKMDDGTPGKECFAVAEYDANARPEERFSPVNCHSSYDGAGVPVLDYEVVSWRVIDF